MLCLFLLYRKVNQLCIDMYPLFFRFFPYRALQSIEQSFLCYRVGPYQLSILYIVVCICQSQSPNLSPLLSPLGNHKFVFYICDSISVFVNKFICTLFFRFHIQTVPMIFLYLTSLSMTGHPCGCSRNEHNTVNQLYFNQNKINKKKF